MLYRFSFSFFFKSKPFCHTPERRVQLKGTKVYFELYLVTVSIVSKSNNVGRFRLSTTIESIESISKSMEFRSFCFWYTFFQFLFLF